MWRVAQCNAQYRFNSGFDFFSIRFFVWGRSDFDFSAGRVPIIMV